MHARKILALEGEWDKKLTHTESVAPALQFLQQVYEIPYVHRRVPTKDAFLHYLDWGVKEGFRILYLGGHGEKEGLHMGSEESGTVTLADIETCLAGRLGYNDVVVHFGTCGLIQPGNRAIQAFKGSTKARLVSGYTQDIDFLDSMLLDMAWFSFLQGKGAFDATGDFVKGKYARLGKELGFVVI